MKFFHLGLASFILLTSLTWTSGVSAQQSVTPSPGATTGPESAQVAPQSEPNSVAKETVSTTEAASSAASAVSFAKAAADHAAASVHAASVSDFASARQAADAAAKDAQNAENAAAVAALLASIAKSEKASNLKTLIESSNEAKLAAKNAHESSRIAKKVAALKDKPTQGSTTCSYSWNDCDWQYWVIGGGEESALSSQDNQTNPFVSLFVRAPNDNRNGSIWLLARFLGAATANSTNNIVAATQSALGSGSTSGLPQVGNAVDYSIGFQRDFFTASPESPGKGGFTGGAIVEFGATTPLSTQHATAAFVVPSYGTNECAELLKRFPSNRAGLPAQPSTPYITTTTTRTGGSSTSTVSGPFCIINAVPITSTNSDGSTTAVTGTAQTDIAFAPNDRSSFLLKYAFGARLVNRWHNQEKDNVTCKSVSCTRTVVDLTVGQDAAITGGMLRHFVGKAEAVFPVPRASNICFFGSASMRFSRNQDHPPLILQPATIVTTSPTPPATIIVPSTSTWVLPLTQPNRDFYRIGIGIDLTDLIGKAFAPKS